MHSKDTLRIYKSLVALIWTMSLASCFSERRPNELKVKKTFDDIAEWLIGSAGKSGQLIPLLGQAVCQFKTQRSVDHGRLW